MNSNDLLTSLIENDAIQIGQEASSWEKAVAILFKPLVQAKVCQEKYIDDVIASTKKYGPYYIISPNLAMPHAVSENVDTDGFTLTTFNKKIFLNKVDGAQLFFGFCAKDPKNHALKAIPQIVKVFENVSNIEKILNASTKLEIINIIKEAIK